MPRLPLALVSCSHAANDQRLKRTTCSSQVYLHFGSFHHGAPFLSNSRWFIRFSFVGIANLEIRENRIIGYFVEVSAKLAPKLEGNSQFFLRQDLSDRRRYKTEELIALESMLGRAQTDVIVMELQMFDQLCQEVNIGKRQLCEKQAIVVGFIMFEDFWCFSSFSRIMSH
jgi:hypothetical protein